MSGEDDCGRLTSPSIIFEEKTLGRKKIEGKNDLWKAKKEAKVRIWRKHKACESNG